LLLTCRFLVVLLVDRRTRVQRRCLHAPVSAGNPAATVPTLAVRLHYRQRGTCSQRLWAEALEDHLDIDLVFGVPLFIMAAISFFGPFLARRSGVAR